jgi:hypothetical protein
MSSAPRSSPAPGRAPRGTSAGTAEPDLPRSGDVVEVGRTASVQFSTPMLFRVIRVLDWPTYPGWVWLDGYQLNSIGEAVDRRSIFVQVGGLRRVAPPRPTPRRR